MMAKFEGFSKKEQNQIETILSNFDGNFINETFKKITNSHDLNTKNDDKYSIFGKYNINSKELKLNPRVFIVEDYEDGKKKLSKLGFIILHEIAHALDRKYKFSSKEEWEKLSGWVEDPIIKKGKKNLIIPYKNGETQSNWYFDKDKEDFPRWYSSMNPKEDFCDSFAFIYSGLKNRFKSDGKIKYINHLIATLKTKKEI